MKNLLSKLVPFNSKLFGTAKEKAVVNVAIGKPAWDTDEETLKSYNNGNADMLPEVVADLIKSAAFDKNGKVVKTPVKNAEEKGAEPGDKLNRRVLIPTITLFEGGSSREDVFMGMNRLFWRFEYVVDDTAATCENGHLENNGYANPLIQVRVAHGGRPAYDDMKQAINNGLEFNGRKYVFLLSSNAQTRTDGAWFIDSNIDVTAIYNYITNGDWSKAISMGEKVVMAKFAKYLGLAVTTSTRVDLRREVKLSYVDSIIDEVSGREYSDGCCICRRSLMKEIFKVSGKPMPELGTAIQIRGDGELWSLKGMLMSVPDKLYESRFGDSEIVVTGTTLKVKITKCPSVWDNAIIYVVNDFDTKDSDKRLSFMFTENMVASSAKKAVAEEIAREFDAMRNCFNSAEAAISYFSNGYEGIQVADTIKALIKVNGDSIKDKLVFEGMKYQMLHRISDLKAGKLAGLTNQCFLPDPSVFFEGKFDGKNIIFDEETKKNLLLRGDEIATAVEGTKVAIMRSPSNLRGQIVKAANKLHDLPEMLTINGVKISKTQLFYLGTRMSNFIWFSQDSDMLLVLAGADEDGDCGKIAILEPTEKLVKDCNGNKDLITAKIGPWSKAFKPGKAFVAIGDTKATKEKVILSYESLKENKRKSLIQDNTGIITNNAFCICDLMWSILMAPTEHLFAEKGYNGVLTSSALFVLSRMAYSAMDAVKNNLAYYEEMFDERIVDIIKSTASYWTFISRTNIGSGTLNDAMRTGKVALIKNVATKNAEFEARFVKATALFLNRCLALMGHLQMIQIDAATTNRYPDLNRFAFARLQQKKGEETINVRPHWFIAVKGLNHDKGVYHSYSTQGFIYDEVCKLEKELMALELTDPKPLFSATPSKKIVAPMQRFFSNLYQADSLYKDYWRIASAGMDSDAKEDLKKQKDRAFKTIFRLKAEPFYGVFEVEDVLNAAYACATRSMVSKTRRSAFLTYFGERAVMFFSQKENARMYKATISSEYAAGMQTGDKFDIIVRGGSIFIHESVEIGTTKAVDGEGKVFFMNGSFWVNIMPAQVEGAIEVSIASSNTGVNAIDGKEVSFKTARATFRGKPVYVMEIYRGQRKHGIVVTQDFDKVIHLDGKTGVIAIGPDGLNGRVTRATIIA